uniref:Retrotransposon gag domain-containing protein n=1 Tax=Lepisosteus oculatus TaxID=7918 RepID=W5LZZ7_LEPOC
MDPADQSQLSILLEHSQNLDLLTTGVQQLADHFALPPSPPPAAPAPAPPVQTQINLLPPPLPEKFDGDSSSCQGFLTQCQMAFHIRPDCFPNDGERIAFMVSCLSGRALEWAGHLLSRNAPETANFPLFQTALQSAFGQLHSHHLIVARLTSLTQGSRSFQDYSSEFHFLAAQLAWDHNALIHYFRLGLSDELKDHVVHLPLDFPSLDSFISRVFELELRLQQRRSDNRTPPTPSQLHSFHRLTSEPP